MDNDSSIITPEYIGKQNVKWIRSYLKRKGISAGRKKKVELVELAIKAAEADLEDCESSEEYNAIKQSIERRTISGILYPHIRDLSGWKNDLSELPTLKSGALYGYLSNVCDWPKQRLQNYEKDDGYELYKETHIREVKAAIHSSEEQVDYIYYKATCVPETRQTAPPYNLWILCQGGTEILTGECECPAGDGTCKHAVALLFWLHEKGINSTSVSVTDGPNQWEMGQKKKASPVPAHKLKGNQIHRDCHYTRYDPILNHGLSPDEIINEFSILLDGTDALMLTSLKPIALSENPNLPKTLMDIVKETTVDSYMSALEEEYCTETCKALEEATRGQGKTLLWQSYRQGRLTASKFKAAYTYSKEEELNSVVKYVLQMYEHVDSEAFRYGHKHEPVARKKYIKLHKATHKNVQVHESGLCIDPSCPHLGASPDGFVNCDICGQGVIEIKSPINARQESMAYACKLKSVFCTYSNGKLVLKENSPWYFQVQGQLYITGRTWCDFILSTEVDMKVCRVTYDPEFCSKLHRQLDAFYFKWILPELF